MGKDRLKQIEKIFQNEITGFLTQKLAGQLGLLTISKVKVSADLKTAKVWLRTYPEDFSEDFLKKKLSPHIKDLVSHLQSKIKLKYMPHLDFFKDADFEEILKVEKLLDQIKK